MEVKDIIDLKTVKTNMNVNTKEEALKELANLLLENGNISDEKGFIKDIYVREAEGQTGIGNYLAIPHGKSAYVKKIGVAIGINSTEIPWESLDDNGVKGIILLLWAMIIKKQLAILNYYHCLPENSEMMK